MSDNVSSRVIEAAEEIASAEVQPGGLTLSTGVVVRAKPMSKQVYVKVLRKFPPPTVPVVYMPDKEREEENPSDPEYLRALQEQRITSALAIGDAAQVLGLEVVSIPEGFPGPGSPEWLEERDLLGLSSGDSSAARRLDWMKYKAAPADDDYKAIMLAVGRATGTPEADVTEAVKSTGRAA